jgi:hypothetical protein
VQVAEDVETRAEAEAGRADLEVIWPGLVLGDQLVEQAEAGGGHGVP